MKVALLSMAMLGSQLVTPVSDRVPKLNVEATCKASVTADKEMGLALPQSYDDCMRTRTLRNNNYHPFGSQAPAN